MKLETSDIVIFKGIQYVFYVNPGEEHSNDGLLLCWARVNRWLDVCHMGCLCACGIQRSWNIFACLRCGCTHIVLSVHPEKGPIKMQASCKYVAAAFVLGSSAASLKIMEIPVFSQLFVSSVN